MDKKGQTGLIIGVIIALLVIVVIVVVVYYNSNITGGTVGVPNQETNTELVKEQNCRKVKLPYEEEEEYIETIPYIDTICKTEDLPYSVEYLTQNYETCNDNEQVCEENFLGIPYNCKTYCVDKSISCSLTLNNLDNEESGTWETKFSFYEVGTSNTIAYDTRNTFLYPKTSKIVQGTARIQSSGIDGDANKDLTCTYSISKKATKQICEEVTRYRDVTRTKKITQYRTETVCD